MTTPTTDEQLDALARALGPLAPPPDDEPDLALLLAYRAGTLGDEAEVARAEATLAADPAARAFLEDLGVAPSELDVARRVREGLAAVGAAQATRAAGGGGEVVPLRRRRWLAPTVTLLAMAAAVLVFALRPRPDAVPDPPAFSVTRHVGTVKEMRGDESPEPAAVYAVYRAAQLELKLETQGEPETPLHARAFVDGPDGALVAASVQGVMDDSGAWSLELPAPTLFGDRYGPRALHVAFSTDPARLDGLEGTRPTADDNDGVRWVTLPFEYREEAE